MSLECPVGQRIRRALEEVERRVARAVEEELAVTTICDLAHATRAVAAEDVSIPWRNGHGMNWKGLYDPEVVEYYGTRWHADPGQFSETVKLVRPAGRYAIDRYQGKHHASPLQATLLPKPAADCEEVIPRALEMIANTCVTDVTGHPACSVPAGFVNGLPTGMMIIGKHFDDATVLRVAHTFEQAVGGVSTPEAAAARSRR